ncbi:hypothetical protein BV898_13912 [Hypsibius exemplaris]|uniref:Tetraspanin n=1 Tax=Hypsibius exemplaris TaxID=2072580 RepID=A0A1W0W997_HYPEX|nr:hypothetical protein BV898_13912 [Hypsibius exemplaris]
MDDFEKRQRTRSRCFTLLFFNIVYWGSGVGLITAGIDRNINVTPYRVFQDPLYREVPVLLITAGALVVAVAGLGTCFICCSDDVRWVTRLRALLLALWILAVAGMSAGLVLRAQMPAWTERNMRASLHDASYNGADQPIWDALQAEHECCGVLRYKDWSKEKYIAGENYNHTTADRIPLACCKPYKERPLAHNTYTCQFYVSELTNACDFKEQTTACPIWWKKGRS